MIEVSVVIPCLNEEETIAPCITKAQESFKSAGLEGEVIIVDNGSTDRSAEIAKGLGARVISEKEKGYGSALRCGIEEAQGKYIIMGDGDDTYDFSQGYKFVAALKEGSDLVMGSRFNGQIMPGAMSWSHRYVGNPILSGILRLFFGGNVSDSHCGLRAFTKEAYNNMGLHTSGMEFASEMVIHSLKKHLKISEIPIVYYARRGESKLDSFRDAWRHMRFMLLYSPDYLFLLPGAFMFLVGLYFTLKFLGGPIWFAGRNWDIHVMVFTGIFTVIGWQVLLLGMSAKIFAYQIGIEDSAFNKKLSNIMSLEKTLVLGLLFLLTGLLFTLYMLYAWYNAGFGELKQIKTGLFALIMVAAGLQTIFTAFLTSLFRIQYKK